MSKIQNSDVKSEAELISAGASASSLIHDSKIYVTANAINKTLDDAIIDGDIGGGGQGGINYVENYDFELNASGYSTYEDAVAASPVDGTGGTANITFVRSTFSPLRGAASGLLTKDAANRQGEGWSYPITIDVADQAKMLRVSFDYATSVNYVDADIKLFIYDITNSVLIEIVDRDLLANANGKFIGSFQSSPDSVNYRLIAHISSVNALSYTVKFDNVKVGPQELSSGAIVTDWEALTGVTTSNFTTSAIVAKVKREGDNARINIRVTSSSVASGVLEVILPSWLQIDETKLNANQAWLDGTAVYTDTSTNTLYVGKAYQSTLNSQTLRFYGPNTVTWGVGTPVSMASGDVIDIQITVPIAGWSSNMRISENLGNREVNFRALGATATLSAVLSKATFTTVMDDTTASYSSGTFTIPESGFYDITGQLRIGGTGAINQAITTSLYYNGAAQINTVWRYQAATSIDQQIQFNFPISLNKGDTIEIYVASAATTPTITATNNNFLFISKRQSPQTLAGGEVVAARAVNTAGTSVSNTGTTTLVYDSSKTFDTHNALNTATGVFTAPVSGIYRISTMIGFAGAIYTVANAAYPFLYKNGSQYSILGVTRAHTTSSINLEACGSDTLYLSKGDTVKIEMVNNRTAGATLLNTSSTVNYFAIEKVN